jgi:hypothetical protein
VRDARAAPLGLGGAASEELDSFEVPQFLESAQDELQALIADGGGGEEAPAEEPKERKHFEPKRTQHDIQGAIQLQMAETVPQIGARTAAAA